jgi:hypothetical protein
LDERFGRHVKIKQYYDQTARYSVDTVEYLGDDPVGAQARIYEVKFMVSADIPLVQLVRAPGPWEPMVGVRFE